MEAGGDPEGFWRLTPAEVVRAQGAMMRRQRLDQDRAAWTAWHIAALQRVKRLPKLKDMLSGGDARRRQRPRQTPEQLEHALRLFFIGAGGDPKELKSK